MSAKDHRERDGVCLWDHEVWPCKAVTLIAEVRHEVAAEIRPKGDEPACCDEHVAVWQALQDAADEIVDGIPKGAL